MITLFTLNTMVMREREREWEKLLICSASVNRVGQKWSSVWRCTGDLLKASWRPFMGLYKIFLTLVFLCCHVSSHTCRCLIKDFETRPSVTHLLEHPFIKQAHGKDASLRQKLSVLIREQQDVGSRTKTRYIPLGEIHNHVSWNGRCRNNSCSTFVKKQHCLK